MLDEYNVFAKSFRMTIERYDKFQKMNLNLQFIVGMKKDRRIYNLPTVSEVVAVIVGDASQPINRDITIEKQSRQLQRINELHASYLGLQYPLLFPYGKNGYNNDIKHKDMDDSDQRKRNKVTIKEFLCFSLHSRNGEGQTLLRSKRLV